jgi:hypothetical protein
MPNSSTAKPTANGQNFDQLYRNAELEMSRLNIEKARRLYQEIDKLSGTVSS